MSQECKSQMLLNTSQTHTRVQIPCMRPYLQNDMNCLEKVQHCCARIAFQEFNSESSVSSLMHTQQAKKKICVFPISWAYKTE